MKTSTVQPLKSMLTLVLGGCVMTLGGLLFGSLAAMQAYGMGMPILYEYGALPGYEGLALFGGMLGAAVFSTSFLVATIKRSRGSVAGVLSLSIVLWFFAFILQDLCTTVTRTSAIPIAFAPSVILGILGPWLVRRK